MRDYLFTSESVSEGHPDKMCDQISDAVLDAILAQDSRGRVACETLATNGLIVVAGEVTTKAQIDIPSIVRNVVKDIGYDGGDACFDYRSCGIIPTIGKQSPDIAMGVDSSSNKEQGAGDQGLMFGYAVDETPEKMPLTISLAHRLVRELAKARKSKKIDFLLPDAKSQVTAEYIGGAVKRIDTIVLSTQHKESASQKQVQDAVYEEVVKRVIPTDWMDSRTKILVNPTGRFVYGGPSADCGLTGRKIIVDTYGGHGSHGGGAFSGKDPSKVDRSAAYAARHVAKNIVAAGFAKRCLVQVAYAIGVAEPVSVMVNDYGTATVDIHVLEKAVRKVWNLKPAGIIEELDLLKPRYRASAAYGHFGREESSFTWEQTNKIDQLKEAVKFVK